MKIIPKSWIDIACQKTLRMFEKSKTEYVSCLSNGITKDKTMRYLRRKSDFYDIVDKDFEGHLFPVPQNYDEVLTQDFGNYMTLPTEENRFPHHGIFEVKF